MKKEKLQNEVFDIVASFLNDINVDDAAIQHVQGSYGDGKCEALVQISGSAIEAAYPGITTDDLNELGKDVLHNMEASDGTVITAHITLTGQVPTVQWPGTTSGPGAPPSTPTGPAAPSDIDENALGNGAMMHGASCPKCGNKSNHTAAGKDGRLKCSKCGHIFSPKAFQLNTAPSTEQYTTPYESDVRVTSQQIDDDPMINGDDTIKRHLKNMGIPDDRIADVLQMVKEKHDVNQTQVNENTTNDTSSEQMNPMKPMNQISKNKKAWFDEPVERNPGEGPYPGATSFAEAKNDQKKKDKYKEESKDRKPTKEEEGEVFEIITILDGIDILPFLEDDDLLADLLAEFPILGREDISIDHLFVTGQVNSIPGIESAPSHGQYEAPDGDDDYEEDPETIAEDELDRPEEDMEDADDTESGLVDEELAIEIGEGIGINWEEVSFSPKEFAIGVEIEFEHGAGDPDTDVTGDDLLETAKIAWAHLKEIDDYYTRLLKMEQEAEKETQDAEDDASDGDSGDSEKEGEDSDDDTEESDAPRGDVGAFDSGFPMSGGAYVPLCEN